jgi:DNA-binding SARP family transcriptional activator/tetratricopeptide (TPR) repeat protein
VQGVEYRLLGPVSVYHRSTVVGLGSSRNRSILAALLLEANRVVPVERLIAAAWDDDPPAGARVQAQNRVSALRKALRSAVPGEDLISTTGSGYAIRVHTGQLDVDRFARGMARADSLAGTGDYAGAVDEVGGALALWQGPALDGQASASLRAAAQRFEEQRLLAVERRIQLRASLGQYAQLPAELSDLIQEHPYREGLRALQMVVLYRCGRAADALQAYLETRNVFADELGIAPGDLLQQLQVAVLRTDEAELGRIAGELGIANGSRLPAPEVAEVTAAAVPAAAPAVVPRELPLDLPRFTGRQAETTELTDALAGGGVVAIHGPGGVGKSALAVHVGHRLADRFSDGQLYVNLRGATPNVDPLRPAEVLAQFLRSLGAGSAGTASLDELAARYRSATAGKRLLILLDDAADSAQIRPLIPGSAGCAVLVTSRRQLSGVDGAGRHRLRPFPESDAVDLLSRLVSDGRISGAPAATGELVRLCDRSPLALSIAAGRLNARPTWSASTLVSRLRDQRHRLEELTDEDRAVRASFLTSYQDLARDAGRMFRLLGLLDVTDLSVPLAAAVSGGSDGVAEKLLDLLVDAQLVENDAPGRYRMHDLLRLYARERAAAEESAVEQAAALRRAFDFYLATVRNASLAIRPMYRVIVDLEPLDLVHEGVPLRGHADAARWIHSERGNLLAVVRQAAGSPAIGTEAVIALATALQLPMGYAGLGRDQAALLSVAERASARTSSPSHLAAAAFVRGGELHALRPREAAESLELAVRLWRELGNREGQAIALTHLGTTYAALQLDAESLASLESALQLAREAGDLEGEIGCLDHLGLAYRRMRRGSDAISAHTDALRLSRQVGHRAGEVITAGNLATALHVFGDLDAALPAYEEALGLARTNGNRQVEAECLWGLAGVLIEVGRIAEGLAYRGDSAEILLDLGWITAAERKDITSRPDPPVPVGFWTNI